VTAPKFCIVRRDNSRLSTEQRSIGDASIEPLIRVRIKTSVCSCRRLESQKPRASARRLICDGRGSWLMNAEQANVMQVWALFSCGEREVTNVPPLWGFDLCCGSFPGAYAPGY